MPHTKEYKRFHLWLKAVNNHPSIKAVEQDKEKVLAFSKPHAEGNAKSELMGAICRVSSSYFLACLLFFHEIPSFSYFSGFY